MNDASRIKRRSWLVTGAAGFIGCNVVHTLLSRGDEVVGFDNFFSGERANVDRLEQGHAGRFKFVEGDILDQAALERALDGCAKVVHLAGQVSVARSIDDPEETHAVNGTGFLRTFSAATNSGVESFIYASSCAVYGDNPVLPLAEDASPRPMSPYAATKLSNEAYAAGLSVMAPNMTSVGLRFFNIFGPWQSVTGGYAAVVPRWINLLLEGGRPPLFGDGSATRDFCYVGDVCEAILYAAAWKDRPHAVFNVATGVRTRLDDLYLTICRVLQQCGLARDLPAAERFDPRPGDVPHSVGDPTLAARDLGFSAAVNIELGLRRILIEQYGAVAQAADLVS